MPARMRIAGTDRRQRVARDDGRQGRAGVRAVLGHDADDRQPPAVGLYAQVRGEGSVAGFANGEAKVTLAPSAGGHTLLTYAVHAQVGGKLAQIGSRLIDGAAAKLAEDFFARFSEHVAPSRRGRRGADGAGGRGARAGVACVDSLGVPRDHRGDPRVPCLPRRALTSPVGIERQRVVSGRMPSAYAIVVVPAKAGTQRRRLRRRDELSLRRWVPAPDSCTRGHVFAGTTSVQDSCVVATVS